MESDIAKPIPGWIIAPKSDRPEMAANRQFTLGMRLLRAVQDNLDQTDFTLDDIREAMGADTRIAAKLDKRVRYGQSHLDFLEGMGIIYEDQNNPGHYCIAQDHPIVIQTQGADYTELEQDFS